MADKKLTVKLTEGQIEYLRGLVSAMPTTIAKANLIGEFNQVLDSARKVGN